MTRFEIYRHGAYINHAESEDALQQWLQNNVAVRSAVTGELKATQHRSLPTLLDDAKGAGYAVCKIQTEREWL